MTTIFEIEFRRSMPLGSLAMAGQKLFADSKETAERFVDWYNAHMVQTKPACVLLDDGRLVGLDSKERIDIPGVRFLGCFPDEDALGIFTGRPMSILGVKPIEDAEADQLRFTVGLGYRW